MKPKKGNQKLTNQNSKKRRQKQKNKSQKSESQVNDDSLDLILVTQTKAGRQLTKSKDQISEEDLHQLRTCISKQFKKSNYINFSSIKNKSNIIQLQPSKDYAIQGCKEQARNEYEKTEQKDKIQSNMCEGESNKRNLLFCHNRSQSCPFIEPLHINENMWTKDGRSEYPGIVFSSVKIDNQQQKKKISMQYLTKNRNKFNVGGSAQKKNPNHNYSNSLTQSSNTVIVHNIPNDIHQNITPNQNLSSILYQKLQDYQQPKITPNAQNNQYHHNHKNKHHANPIKLNSNLKLPNPHKKIPNVQKSENKQTLTSICLKQDFFIKTKIQQKINTYQIKQDKHQLQIDSKAFLIKQEILQKLLIPYKHSKSHHLKQNSLNSEKQSILIDGRGGL